jgi:pimeloyl-ACP methyl ester carboxylesterase
MEKTAGDYAAINGLTMYYEIQGAGAPLVLLHGGVGALEMLAPLMPIVAESRRVVAVDLQGHGRTADIDRPLRYELMADDIAALLQHLSIEQADLLGYSLGAGVALRTTFQHPELVRKLVVIAAPCKRDGWYPDVLAAIARMGPDSIQTIKKSPWYGLYPNVNWPRLLTKLGDLLTRDYDWSEEVAAIKAPTMLVFADADSVRITHIAEFYALLGGGQKDAGWDGSGRPPNQLAVLPGYTHYNLLSSPALAAILPGFLNEPEGGLARRL